MTPMKTVYLVMIVAGAILLFFVVTSAGLVGQDKMAAEACYQVGYTGGGRVIDDHIYCESGDGTLVSFSEVGNWYRLSPGGLLACPWPE